MNRLNYRTMSFAQIHDDLLETANDLCFNAGVQQLELLQPRGQELMRFAVDEMLILAGKIGHNPDRLAASRACIKKKRRSLLASH